MATRLVVPEVAPAAGHRRHLVGAPADPGLVDGERHRRLRAGVVPGLVEVRTGVEDLVGVCQLGGVDGPELALALELDHPLGDGEDDVVLVARRELGVHAFHRVVVGLDDLDAVLLLEALDDARGQVVGPVEVDEVAVDLRLGRRRQRSVGRCVVADVGATGQCQRRAQSQSAGQQTPSRGPGTDATGVRGHAPAPPENTAGAGSGPSWPTRTPTAVGDRAARLLDAHDGVARKHAGAETVGHRDRRLRDQPRVERSGEDPGGHALADDVGQRDVEVLVELGADLGEVRVADAEQGQLLPQQPLVRTLLVAGQAPVEEGRQAFGGPFARVGQGALVELGGGLVRCLQHLAEEKLLGVEVVVEQARRDTRRPRDRGHPDLGQTIANDAVSSGREDPGASFRRCLLALARTGRRLVCHGLHLFDCSVSE